MKRVVTLTLLILMSCLTPLNAQPVEEDTDFYIEEVSDDPVIIHAAAVVTIQGVISDQANNPVEKVQVMLLGNNSVVSTYTDKTGKYKFSKLVGGKRYTVMPTKYGFIEPIDKSQVSGASLVEIAKKELGNTDGEAPGRYHGHGGGWCSEFVSWVYQQGGDPFTGGIDDGGTCKKDWLMSSVYKVAAGFGRNENWQILSIDQINAGWKDTPDNPVKPQPGDYVIFSNTSGIDRSHSGMVKEVQGANLQTIEGNVSDLVKEKTRKNWRTYQDGKTVVKGIGYRRIVSNNTFDPRFVYETIDSDTTVDFKLVTNTDVPMAPKSLRIRPATLPAIIFPKSE